LVEHLTQRQFEDYRLRRLQAAELLSVSDHIGECEPCRRRVEAAADGDATFFDARSELFGEAAEGYAPRSARAHLTAEETADYVDGTLAGERLETASGHLSSCEHCALSIEDLRAFRDEVAPALGREYRPAAAPASTESRWRRAFGSLSSLFHASPVPAFGAALAVVLLALTGWVVWRATREGEPSREVVVAPAPTSQPTPVEAAPTPSPSPPEPVPPEVAAVVAQLNDGGGRLTLDREGTLSGADALPNAYREMLKGALANRRIEKSPQLDGLSRPGSSLMSSDGRGAEFSALEPAGSVLLTDRPTFRWSELEGAAGYVVEVYDAGFKLVASSPRLDARSWAAPQTLPRGQVYSWQVTAFKDGQEIKSPRPPAPQARFRILDRAKADELARARRAYPSSHLTLGLLYARAGLLKEAEQELRLLQRANPDSEVARGLLRQIQALRRRGE
jgi:hypothetical protein